MTVPSTPRRSPVFTGDGAATAYPFAFKVFATSDIQVLVTSVAGVISTAVLNVDYTVALNADQTTSPGGTVNMAAPPAIGVKLVTIGNLPYDQTLSLPGGGNFNPVAIENALDRTEIQIQQIAAAQAGSITVPVGEIVPPLPAAAIRAGYTLGFDSLGNPIAVAPVSGSVGTLAADLANSVTPSKGAGQVGFSSALAYGASTVGKWLKDLLGTATPGTDGASMVGLKGPEANEVAKTVYLNLIEVKRVSRWGMDPANTAAANRLALQNAINSGTKRELVFNEGDYQVNDLCTVPNGAKVYMTGQGCGVTRLVQTDLTKGLLKWNLNFDQGGGLHGMTLKANVADGAQGSNGIALQLVKANDQWLARDFEILSFDKGIQVDSSFQPSFKDFRILYFANYGVHFSPYTGAGTDTAGTRWYNAKISNFGYLGANPENSTGLWIEQGSGEFFDTIDITQVGLPVLIAPPAASFARFLKFKTVLADTAYFEGWTLDGTNAPVLNVRMVDCYAAGAGGGANRPVGSTRGAGLLTKGANLDDLIWIGGELRDNDVGGWDHQGGVNCRLIDASVARNSRRIGFDNTYPGVRVRANVSEWAVKGCRIGNFSQGVFAVSQAEGIVIDAGASTHFQITDNDLRNPGAGKVQISNASTSLAFTISDNLPIQTPGVNQDRGAVFTGSSVGTVPAGVTRYLAPGGQQVTENDAYMVTGRPGLVSQFIAQVDVAPGAAQSFTYTVRLNAVNTVMTGSISGAGSFQVILAGAFNVSGGDTLSVQLTTSAGAAAARHRWVINVDS